MKFICFFLLLFLPSAIFAMGFSDWTSNTPGGNEINNFNGKSFIFKDGRTIENLGKWYFYNDHVVGMTSEYYEEKNKIGYFVMNEELKTIDNFTSEEEWRTILEEKHLNPKFYTRWYEGDWKFFNNSPVGFVLFGLVLLIPLYLLLLLINKVTSIKNTFRKNSKIVIVLDVVIIFIIWLTDYFPQSF